MRPYAPLKDLNQLDWWAGSQSQTGNKTPSPLKKKSRRIYKKIARASLKRELNQI